MTHYYLDVLSFRHGETSQSETPAQVSDVKSLSSSSAPVCRSLRKIEIKEGDSQENRSEEMKTETEAYDTEYRVI